MRIPLLEPDPVTPMAGPVIASPHAHAVVHLDAVAHNTALFAAATEAAVMAVVKADGFGHGAVRVASTALAAGATWLGVTTCAEALRLRAGGITAPILSWLHSPLEDFGPRCWPMWTCRCPHGSSCVRSPRARRGWASPPRCT
jgi:alanine racemase